jgi:tRNA-splicing ligase RtcB
MELKQISEVIWELGKGYKASMKVPARVVGTKKIVEEIETKVFNQLANAASLPGVVEPVWAMPDTHIGYDVPIGCVFATNPKEGGVISPGAVGFDINCGVRLMSTQLMEKEVKPKLTKLVDGLFGIAGAGLGSESWIRLTTDELKEVLKEGMEWAVDRNYGRKEDLNHAEAGGKMEPADPKALSEKAIDRGRPQLGTLGSGNHFLEVQKVAEIYNEKKAKELGINKVNQITVMIHCGSRGLGHQVATDYTKKLDKKPMPFAKFNSSDGQEYFKAMNAAANYAFANRQLIMHKTRQVFGKIFKVKPEKLGLDLIYDVTHNMAKLEVKSEQQTANSKKSNKRLLIHRKGATRAFENQPVIIGGSMETASYLLLGTKKAVKLTFGSTSHGAGRTKSRTQAKKEVHGKKLQERLKEKGIYIKGASYSGLAEEGGHAYKDIDEVIRAVSDAGISKPIAKFQPIGNVKG